MPKIINANKYYFLYKQQYSLIAGVDEVGRGPLVGNVVAAAVILPQNYSIRFLTDSKLLTDAKRKLAYGDITQQALAYAIGYADHHEIDQVNILQASLNAMCRAVQNLAIQAQFVLIDGNKIPKDLSLPAHCVIGGDATEDVISAASIIAKVTRDQQMYELDQKHPEYGFAQHKGYATKRHLQALKSYGPVPEHRLSFAPVRQSALIAEI